MKRTKCEECGGKIIRKKNIFSLHNNKVGMFPVEVCSKCKEEVYDEKTVDKIIKKLTF